MTYQGEEHLVSVSTTSADVIPVAIVTLSHNRAFRRILGLAGQQLGQVRCFARQIRLGGARQRGPVRRVAVLQQIGGEIRIEQRLVEQLLDRLALCTPDGPASRHGAERRQHEAERRLTALVGVEPALDRLRCQDIRDALRRAGRVRRLAAGAEINALQLAQFGLPPCLPNYLLE